MPAGRRSTCIFPAVARNLHLPEPGDLELGAALSAHEVHLERLDVLRLGGRGFHVGVGREHAQRRDADAPDQRTDQDRGDHQQPVRHASTLTVGRRTGSAARSRPGRASRRRPGGTPQCSLRARSARFAVLLRGRAALLVDAAHDLAQPFVHAFPGPRQAHRVLRHLEAAHGDAPGVRGLPGP